MRLVSCLSLWVLCVCVHIINWQVLYLSMEWNEIAFVKKYIYSPSFLTDANSSRHTLYLMLFYCSSDSLFLCSDIHLFLKQLTSNIQLCYILSCCACHPFTIWFHNHIILNEYGNFFYKVIDLLEKWKRWSKWYLFFLCKVFLYLSYWKCTTFC